MPIINVERGNALRHAQLFARGYLALSALTLAAVVLLRHHPGLVTPAVWVRGTIVLISAVVTTIFAARAARGSVAARRRLRIISTVMTVAIVVIIALPGDFPVWLKVEQGVCGALLIGVLVALRRQRT